MIFARSPYPLILNIKYMIDSCRVFFIAFIFACVFTITPLLKNNLNICSKFRVKNTERKKLRILIMVL